MVNEFLDGFFARHKKKDEGLTFDDVLLMPQESNIVPRDTNLETRITRNVPLKIPVVSADMDTVTEAGMAIVLAKEGGMGFIHRNMTIEEQAIEVNRVKFTLNAFIETPVCLSPDNTLEDLANEIKKYDNRFSSFIITDKKGELVGFVTRDQTKFYDAKKDGGILLKDLMIKAYSIDHMVDVPKAYEIMKKRGMSKLIITDDSRKVIGLYCWKDVKDIIENTNPMYNRNKKGQLIVGASIGVYDFERAEKLLKKKVDVLLVGTAHGHSRNVGETVKELKKQFADYEFDVLAGNVATEEGAEYLRKCGADGIKIGVGGGSICTTRVVAGVGVPQLTAVYESCKGAGDVPANADGGLRYSGDMAKALAIGASSLMCGGLFAATNESPGRVIIFKGKPHKDYRGMGSVEAMRDFAESRERYKQDEENPEKLVPEGVKGLVPLRGSVSELIFQIAGGIKASFGYLGAQDIEEFHKKAVLIRPTLAGQVESHPHDVVITSEPPNYQIRNEGND